MSDLICFPCDANTETFDAYFRNSDYKVDCFTQKIGMYMYKDVTSTEKNQKFIEEHIVALLIVVALFNFAQKSIK